MSIIKKKLIFPVLALAVLSLGVLDVGLASANDNYNSQSTLVQKVADKFNLDKNEVQQVFDEVRNERRQEMKNREEVRLSQLVTDGKITEEQKALIQEKQEELKTARESNKDSFRKLSHEGRHAQMEERRAEIESWASENGVDIEYVMPFGKGHGLRGGDFK